jgi:glycerol-3-phosphate cytidylyltransferase-like family protein
MFIFDLFEAQARQVLVVIPGGFHPFHPGHLSLYQSAEKAFPGATIVYAATDDRKERPFAFADKQKLAQIAGVNPANFQLVRSPFVCKEITEKFDPNSTVLIFARSEKDRDQQPKPGGVKKDGSPSYLQPYTKGNLAPMSQHGYMAYLPVVQFKAGPSGVTSATQIREMWPQANAAQKQQIVADLYPKNPKLAMQILDKYLGNVVAENTLTEFDRGENGFGPFKVYLENHFIKQFSTFDEAKDEVDFLRDSDPKSATHHWQIKDGTGETVWEFDVGAAYDAMRRGKKIQHRNPGQQGMTENSLNEFAVDDNGGGGVDYLRVLASAWYNHDLSQLADLARQGGKPLKKIIDAQEAVEKMLARGVICPDGKTRKFYIDYSGEFNGVDMVSYDYYEHSDYDDAGNEIDDRTGKPWGAYDHLEFHGNDLGESVEQGMAEDGPGMDPTVIQMKKRAKIAHPFASSDEEALALYVADRSKKADSDIRDQQERDEQVIDRIDGAESKLEKEVARIDAILAQLSKVR